MNVEGNKSTEYVAKDLYYGLANMNVVAFNPNNTVKQELGLYVGNPEEEDDYLLRDESNKVTGAKFQFILKYASQSPTDDRDMNIIPVTFWVKAEQAIYASGWTEYCNNSGATVIVQDKSQLEDPKYAWFMNEGNVRITLKGEGQLLQFMNNFFDIKKGAACNIPVADYKAKYFKGQFDDFRTLIAGYPDNKVKCLLGIKEYTTKDEEVKYLQDVVNSFFFRHWSKGDKLFKQLEMNVTRYQKSDSKYQLIIPELPCDLTMWSPKLLNQDAPGADEDPFGSADTDAKQAAESEWADL
jgi:hypothetical protein